MASSDLERLIEDWALAWLLPDTLEKLLSLFTDGCVYKESSYRRKGIHLAVYPLNVSAIAELSWNYTEKCNSLGLYEHFNH